MDIQKDHDDGLACSLGMRWDRIGLLPAAQEHSGQDKEPGSIYGKRGTLPSL